MNQSRHGSPDSLVDSLRSFLIIVTEACESAWAARKLRRCHSSSHSRTQIQEDSKFFNIQDFATEANIFLCKRMADLCSMRRRRQYIFSFFKKSNNSSIINHSFDDLSEPNDALR